MGECRVIADHRGVNRATLHDVVRRRSHRGPISRCLRNFWSCSKICCDSRSCGVSKDDGAMSYDVTYDIVRRRGSSHDICVIDVRWRHTTSSMIVRRRKTLSKIVRHRTTVIRSSYDHRATLIYKTVLVSHHAIIVKSYDYRTTIVRLSYDYRTTIVRLSYDYRTTIVRLSYDYRTTIVRLSYDVVRFTYALASHQAITVKSYVIVRLSFDCRTMSYDIVWCSTM